MFLYNKQGLLVRVAFCVQYALVMLLNNYQSEFFLADIRKSYYLWRVNI
jgi:hypothetical protein